MRLGPNRYHGHRSSRRIGLLLGVIALVAACGSSSPAVARPTTRASTTASCTRYAGYLVPDDPTADMAIGSGQGQTPISPSPVAPTAPRISSSQAVAVVDRSAHPGGGLVRAFHITYSSPGSGPMRFGDRQGSWTVSNGDPVWIVEYRLTLHGQACSPPVRF